MLKYVLLFGLLLVGPASAAPEPPWNGPTNCSGTISAGGTAQSLTLPRALHGYQIQNESADEIAFSELTKTPAINTQGSWSLAPQSSATPGQSYNSPGGYAPSGPIFIIGATTGDGFTCVAW